MPEGKAGVPRPFADSAISINLEFAGEPNVPLGEAPALENEIENKLMELPYISEVSEEGFTGIVESATVYPPAITVVSPQEGDMGGGFEAEVVMTTGGYINKRMINDIENVVIGYVGKDNNHIQTNIIPA